jgi:hypothetical protein
METFRLPGTDDENYWAAPAHGSPIRAVRETVCYVMLLRRLVFRRLVQQQQNCHNHMLSVSRGIRRRAPR